MEPLISLSFFFSSRRRHTRCSRDWSSDVCSSDLADRVAALVDAHATENERAELALSSLAGAHVQFGFTLPELVRIAHSDDVEEGPPLETTPPRSRQSPHGLRYGKSFAFRSASAVSESRRRSEPL